jgi:predicted DNA-binding transcriptional regulator AlpA
MMEIPSGIGHGRLPEPILSPKLYRKTNPFGDDMPSTQSPPDHRFAEYASAHPTGFNDPDPLKGKPPQRSGEGEPLLTVDDVARRLNVSKDWVWDHSSRKKPLLPVIRMGDGALRYRRNAIEAFIDERERVSAMGRRAS